MATESFPNIQEGGLSDGAIIETFRAAGAIDLWSPVVLVAAGSGENFPRVDDTTNLGDEDAIGIAVGPKRASGKAADAAADSVQVCVFGMCKGKVDGNAANIGLGDFLQTGDDPGTAEKLAPFDSPATFTEAGLQAELDLKMGKTLGKALKASTVDGDIIPVFVCAVGGIP